MTRTSRTVIVYAVAVLAFLAGYLGSEVLMSRLFDMRNGVIAAAVAGALVGGVLVAGRRWTNHSGTR
jgi:hypothetical protein